MTEQSATKKMSTRELVAATLSGLIIFSGIVYWVLEALAMVELVQMAYEFSLASIIGRLVAVIVGTSLLVTAVIFVQRRVNKGL